MDLGKHYDSLAVSISKTQKSIQTGKVFKKNTRKVGLVLVRRDGRVIRKVRADYADYRDQTGK